MRNFEQGNLEQYGEGREKRVYKHPEDESKLIAFMKSKENPSLLKAQFYLTKIAHMLFPKNIPDIHFAGGEKVQGLIVEKKDADEVHNIARENAMEFYRTDVLTNKIINEEQKHTNAIADNPAYSRLNSRLEESGFRFDESEINYAVSDNHDLIYYDSLIPWNIVKFSDGTGIQKQFDKDKLVKAIENLPETERTKAFAYLDRLESLYQEETKQHPEF